MSYGDGDLLLFKRVKACHGFTNANTSRADWKVLNSGKSDHYAILKPAGGALEWLTNTMYAATWTTVVEVWQRYVDDSTTAQALYALVGDLLAILAFPNLGDTTEAIIDCTIGEIGPVEVMTGETANWLRWSIPVIWTEESTVTFEE